MKDTADEQTFDQLQLPIQHHRPEVRAALIRANVAALMRVLYADCPRGKDRAQQREAWLEAWNNPAETIKRLNSYWREHWDTFMWVLRNGDLAPLEFEIEAKIQSPERLYHYRGLEHLNRDNVAPFTLAHLLYRAPGRKNTYPVELDRPNVYSDGPVLGRNGFLVFWQGSSDIATLLLNTTFGYDMTDVPWWEFGDRVWEPGLGTYRGPIALLAPMPQERFTLLFGENDELTGLYEFGCAEDNIPAKALHRQKSSLDHGDLVHKYDPHVMSAQDGKKWTIPEMNYARSWTCIPALITGVVANNTQRKVHIATAPVVALARAHGADHIGTVVWSRKWYSKGQRVAHDMWSEISINDEIAINRAHGKRWREDINVAVAHADTLLKSWSYSIRALTGVDHKTPQVEKIYQQFSSIMDAFVVTSITNGTVDTEGLIEALEELLHEYSRPTYMWSVDADGWCGGASMQRNFVTFQNNVQGKVAPLKKKPAASRKTKKKTTKETK